ncbi:MAG: hypothetical protein Q4D29_11365 [Lachnospiraceae bacterium]|nr:hypothetical protein [Lachnospiraceae bacterium]
MLCVDFFYDRNNPYGVTFHLWLYGPALNFVLAGYTSEFINNTTYASSEFLDSVQEFTPITIIRNLCWDAPANAGSLIAAVFFTILLGVFSYLAYVRRPSEATGKSIIYTWFGVLLKFAVVIPCGLTMGLVMYSLQPNAREFWGIFGLIAGTLLTKGLMEILYTFDFRSFLKYKVQTLLSLAAVFAVVSFFIFDPLHVAEYIPSYEKLAGINLETYDEHTSVMYLKLNENEEANIYYHMTQEAMLTKNGTELGEKTYEVLKEIITESKEEHTSLNGSYHTVTYRLKS